ncbi:uncharacterized protein UV8b_04296 [Ustilaginoidea virens]|uniref:Uncharacterized protein n=1 Tax=Ustilaginoidea virens TaxID=1159556 RepID=A0A8E5HRI8_USTVR|nr:uncharacterized protein UV8b_04296 [Ustilaginoidea virens]QUC20055.1 hypothetical protein UV8b_04296 [Ustilaginoidea virens]
MQPCPILGRIRRIAKAAWAVAQTMTLRAFSSRSPYPKQNAPSPHSLAGTQALAASKGPRQQLGPAPRCRYCLGRS